MPDLSREREYREEAERLALLPPADQEAVIDMYRHLAANPLATPSCRVDAKAKADALAKLLGLRPSRKPAKASGKDETVKRSTKARRTR